MSTLPFIRAGYAQGARRARHCSSRGRGRAPCAHAVVVELLRQSARERARVGAQEELEPREQDDPLPGLAPKRTRGGRNRGPHGWSDGWRWFGRGADGSGWRVALERGRVELAEPLPDRRETEPLA